MVDVNAPRNSNLHRSIERWTRVTAYLKDGASKEFSTSDVNGYCTEIEHFVSCVIDDGKPCLDPCDGRETLRVTLATLKSARTTRPVELNSSRGENLGAVKLERG